MPEVVIVDEIGTEAEALACRTIAERGVQVRVCVRGRRALLAGRPRCFCCAGRPGAAPACWSSSAATQQLLARLAPSPKPSASLPPACPPPPPCPPAPQLIGTAHGQLLENLIKNPTLSDLVGGICSVTLGDEEARQRGTQKSVLERKAPPTFPLVIEMRERAYWVTHWVEDSVDCLLTGKVPIVQVGGAVRWGGWGRRLWAGGAGGAVAVACSAGGSMAAGTTAACPSAAVAESFRGASTRACPCRLPLPAGAPPRPGLQEGGGRGVPLRHHW